MSRDNITFLVPAYNCAGFLPQAISSILEGNFQEGDEILVINDASTDSTQAAIDQLAASCSAIRCIRHRFNKGSAAAARNSGIEHSAHSLYFCLDADNLLVPGSVNQLAELQRAGADAVAFGAIHYFSGDNSQRTTHEWHYKPGMISLADALAGHFWPGPSGNYLFTRQSWLRAGRQHEFVGGGIDSWAFGIRQLANGCRMITCPGTYYLHRYGHESAAVRDKHEGGISLKALAVLLPFLHLFEDETVEYLWQEGRNKWFDDLATRPLRVKGMATGKDGMRMSRRYSNRIANIKSRIGSLLFNGSQK